MQKSILLIIINIFLQDNAFGILIFEIIHITHFKKLYVFLYL